MCVCVLVCVCVCARRTLTWLLTTFVVGGKKKHEAEPKLESPTQTAEMAKRPRPKQQAVKIWRTKSRTRRRTRARRRGQKKTVFKRRKHKNLKMRNNNDWAANSRGRAGGEREGGKSSKEKFKSINQNASKTMAKGWQGRVTCMLKATTRQTKWPCVCMCVCVWVWVNAHILVHPHVHRTTTHSCCVWVRRKCSRRGRMTTFGRLLIIDIPSLLPSLCGH